MVYADDSKSSLARGGGSSPLPGTNFMNKIYFITGASGAGKTTTVKKLEDSNSIDIAFCYFDKSKGVPSKEEMERDFGSGTNWQKITTISWVKEVKDTILMHKSAVLDRQARLSFIKEACEINSIDNYEIILFDCEDSVREERLIKRGHPELVNPDMRNWAKFLRSEATECGAKILDTTNLSINESVQELLNILNDKK